MTERLFSSRGLYRTLGLFFDFPHEPLNPRLISRYTRTDIKTTVIVLRKLEGMGLVRSRTAGKFRVYELDGDHALFEELRSVFSKTRGERDRLWRVQSMGMWGHAFEVFPSADILTTSMVENSMHNRSKTGGNS